MSEIDPFAVDRHSTVPLSQQVAAALRQQILDGSLLPGVRLPPTRALARQLGIGRSTIVNAYRQLEQEGFVAGQTGSGTYVTTTAMPADAGVRRPVQLSRWGRRAHTIGQRHTTPRPPSKPTYDFSFGRTFSQTFPYNTWRKLLNRYLSTDDTLLSRYGSAAGFAPLRRALADYVARRRGVHCSVDQIVIVNGIQQAVDIIARLLLDPGDAVLVESPGYTEAYELFTVYGARLHPLPVTANGFDPAALPTAPSARLAFVTPTNQFPRGGSAPLAARITLLDWAAQHNAYVLEDDYDSELYYAGDPPAALRAIDRSERVIYLGTFSKVLFPALRLAYVVLPPPLVSPFLTAKRLIDRGSPTLTQAAIADFLFEGHFDRHMRRLRQLYRTRRAVLLDAMRAHVPELDDYADLPAGLHVMVHLPPQVDEPHLVAACAASGVHVMPGAPYHLAPDPPPSLLLGFSNIDGAQIEDGIRQFGRIVAAQRHAK